MTQFNIIKTALTIVAFLLAWTGGQDFAYAAESNPFILVIDAGHGGKDPGAVGRFSKEKDINLSVAKAFGKMVKENCPDVKVIYTRDEDVFIPLDRRAEIANRANAHLFISIHTNAMPGKIIRRGTETYTLGMARADENLDVAKRENSVILVEDNYQERYQGFDPKSSESYIIFELMQDKYMAQSVDFARHIQREFRTTGGRLDKGVHQAGFLVLRETSMPSVLVELGYISTHDEESFLNSQNGIKKMSQSIYNAFITYKKQHSAKGNTPIQAVTSSSESQVTAENAEPDRQTAEASVQSVAETVADTQTTNASDAKTSAPESTGSKSPVETEKPALPVFKIQLLASTRQIPVGSSRFKKLSPIDFYKDGVFYKYTYGETHDYQEAIKIRNKVKPDFEGAFIIAFKNDKRMDLQQAINEYKKSYKH